jgi:ABC-type nitrate/sulfonate/bicarbonate transport system permease component
VHVTLPFCAPYLLTAAKLARTPSTGVIGSELSLARSGMGYEIRAMPPLPTTRSMYPLIHQLSCSADRK